MMSETEFERRGVIWSFDEPIHYLTAIPWCTTHDRMMDSEDPERYCFEAGSVDDPCVISTGGPDHKWWKDD